MTIFRPHLRALTLGAFASFAAASMGQTYTETTYTFSHDVFTQVLSSFTASSGIRNWSISDDSLFSVTGSSNDSLPWRLLFGHLANNHWTVTASFSHSFVGGEKAKNYVSFYREIGDQGLTPTTGPAVEVSRHLYDHIVTNLWWSLDPPTPGGGPE